MLQSASVILLRIRGTGRFGALLLVATLMIGGLHLAGLGSSPPGQHVDEASFAYAAWCLGHAGVDPHGNSFPLMVAAHAYDWLGPVGVYTLVPLAAIFNSASPALMRVPAALAGIALALVAARLAWRWTHSRAVTVITLVSAGVTPWIFLQSRVSYEDIYLALEVMVFILIVLGTETINRRRGLAAGVLLGLMPLTYFAGRPLGVLLGGAALLTLSSRFARGARTFMVIPALAGLAALLSWSALHPGGLLGRFERVRVGGDGPLQQLLAVIGNGFRLLGTDFLFTRGDVNPRLTTGYGGALLITTLPALFLGAAAVLSRASEPRSRMLVFGTMICVLPAIITEPLAAHRSAAAAPFVIAVTIVGWAELWAVLRQRRLYAAIAAAVAMVVGGGFVVDAFTTYPGRAASSFDAASTRALMRARDEAHGRQVYVNSSIDQPVSLVQAVVLPPCDDHQAQDLGISVVTPTTPLPPAGSGAILVLRHGVDQPPATARYLFSEGATVEQSVYYPDRHDPVSEDYVDVYRL